MSDPASSPSAEPPISYTPNLGSQLAGQLSATFPALIANLPEDDTRAAQHQFTAARQAKFLNRLAACGSARSAVRSAGVSHQTAYRQRRACRPFRRAWDAALVVAREQAEEELACRAIDGVEEEVFYHGESVAKRRRYDSRLLLAHLARLDKLAARADVAMLAEDFDAVVEALEAGRDLPDEPAQDAPTGGRGNGGAASSPVPCNKRSKSPAKPDGEPAAKSRAEALDELECDCPGAVHGTDGGAAHFRMTAQGPQPVANVDGCGPCCEVPRWPDCRDCAHYPAVGRVLEEMDEQRPADAPPMSALGQSDAVEACQMEAFQAGDADWWRYGEDWALFARDGQGGWRALPEDERAAVSDERALVDAGAGG